MENEAITDVHLGSLRVGMPGLSSALGEAYAEAASVCFEQRHVSGVQMTVDGDCVRIIVVTWDGISDQARRSWADLQNAVEHAAYGVAALLISVLTEYTIVAQSCKGTGFDYWLGDKNNPQPLFQRKARLEVSGILDGSESDIRSRMTRKMKQTGEGRLPAFVVVVEFGNPRSRVMKRCSK